MSRTRFTLVLALAASAIPPEFPFAKVQRTTVTSSLSTNGKVEPTEWATVRAGQAGGVE